jgi:D-alanyl-D-alanine carboxypeptidase
MNDIEVDALVNKENRLSYKYVPSYLVSVDNNEHNFHEYANPHMKPLISSVIYMPFVDLEYASIKDGLHITVDSGYRSYGEQVGIFRHQYAKAMLQLLSSRVPLKDINRLAFEQTAQKVAIPGCSEHQTGYAFDIGCYRNGEYQLETTEEEQEWMRENAYKYGFILRYPKGKEEITGIMYEPWHYRYVGEELAYDLYNNGDWVTLEEYHEGMKLKRTI